MSGTAKDSIDEYLRELKVLVLSYEVQSDSETKLKIGEACTSLIQLLPSNSPAVQLSILRFLSNVKDASEYSFRKLFIENKLTLVLASLLNSPSAKIKEFSFNLLRGMLSITDADDEIASVLPKILSIINDGVDPSTNPQENSTSKTKTVITRSQIYAIQLLLVISFKKTSFALFKKYYILRLLRPYLSIQNYLVKLKVCEVLINITYSSLSIIDDVINAHLLEPLIDIIRLRAPPESQDGVTLSALQVCASYVIANITRGTTEQNKAIISTGVIEYLIEFLNSPSDHLRESGSAILTNLSRESPSTCDLILRSNYLPVMLKIVESQEESIKVRSRLIGVFANLSKGSETQRKTVSNLKIVPIIEPIIANINMKAELSSQEVDIYSDILDICIYVVLTNKFHKKFFFEAGVLKQFLPILSATLKSDISTSKEKFVTLQKNFIKFLLLLSKNAREYNLVMLEDCKILDKLVNVLRDADSNKSENIYMMKSLSLSSTDFAKYQDQVFDILTIIYSITVNCKHDYIQKEIVIQRADLFKVLLKFAKSKYNFKIRYISCELMTIMFKIDKEIYGNTVKATDVNISFYKTIDETTIQSIAEVFSKDNNGTEIDYQLVSIISYICAKDNNKHELTKWFEAMLKCGILDKLILIIRTISINNSINNTTIGNVIIVFFSLFKLKSEKLMTLISQDQINQILEFFKNTIAILTKKDVSSHKIVELTVLTVKKYASISAFTRQMIINSGILTVLFLYLYSLSSVHNIKLLPAILETFSEVARGNDQQRLWLLSKFDLITSINKIICNDEELEDNASVKGSAVVLLSYVTATRAPQLDEMFTIGLNKRLLSLACEVQYNNEFKLYAFAALANLAQGTEDQKEQLIAEDILPPVYDIMKELLHLSGSNTPPTSVKVSAMPVFQSPKSTNSNNFVLNVTATKFSSLTKPQKYVHKELLMSCLRLLINLSSGNPRQSSQIITTGFLSIFAETISNSDLNVVEKSCHAIRNISNGGLNHCKAILGIYLIPQLANILASNRNKKSDKPTSVSAIGVNDNESDTKKLRKSIDNHILWTFVNISRFENSARLNVLKSGVLNPLQNLISLNNIQNKEEKVIQKAIISLLNNLIISKDCMMKIVIDYNEIIGALVAALVEYNNRCKAEGINDVGEYDGSDLVVLLLNLLSILSHVDDIKFKTFLLETDLTKVLEDFSNSNAMVVRTLSQGMIASLSK